MVDATYTELFGGKIKVIAELVVDKTVIDPDGEERRVGRIRAFRVERTSDAPEGRVEVSIHTRGREDEKFLSHPGKGELPPVATDRFPFTKGERPMDESKDKVNNPAIIVRWFRGSGS